jgi:hypothetical protein
VSEWWVSRQGTNPVGPVTTDTLVRGIRENKVPEDAVVCRVGEQYWQHVAQVEELWELLHPEQYETNVTKRPWFADKVDSNPPVTSASDHPESDDESTRIYSVPILPIRSVEGSSEPVPSANPTMGTPTTPLTNSRAAVDRKPSAQAATTSPAAEHSPAPRPVIAPPRFGVDRVVPTKLAALSSPPAAGKVETAAANAARPAVTAPTPAADAPKPGVARVGRHATLPSTPHAKILKSSIPPAVSVAAVPRSAVAAAAPATNVTKPAIAPAAPAASVPRPIAAATRARQSTPPAAPRTNQAEPAPASLSVPRPAAAAPSAKPLFQQRPLATLQKPPEPAAAAPAVDPMPAPALAAMPVSATPGAAAQPVDTEDDTETIVALVRPVVPPTPPAMPAPARAPLPIAEDDTETVVAQVKPMVPPTPPAIPAPARAPLPIVPAVEPSDLFDEDYEPPTSQPAAQEVGSTARDSVSPRPAAGTPVPPSVIITYPPPSMPEEALAHAVSPIPEETHPALRSIRPPGTIQVSIGTLVIGALAIVVLVLGAVLLLR